MPNQTFHWRGKCEGMMRQQTSYKHPVSREAHNKVRELQKKLWASAKQDKGRKFHALYDRIYRWDILVEAYKRVRQRHGTYGIDGQTIEQIEEKGVEPFLREIEECLKEGKYRPLPVKRVMIPKSRGGQRPLGIPTVRDRVVQMATTLVMLPIFEADFHGCSFGYRPKRNPVQALERIRETANKGYNYVVDGDIKNYFTSINHAKLIELVERRISDRRVIKLIRQWLKSGVITDGVYEATEEGTPQGSVISPLLSNIYLHEFDRTWETENNSWGVLTRFCDDFVIQCLSKKQAEAVKKKVERILKQMGLTLHPEKTRIVNLSKGKEGFEFLGNHLRKMPSYRFAGKYYLNRWPSSRSEKKVKEKIRGILTRKRFGVKNVREVIPELNRVLQGWGNYFKSGNANRVFGKTDKYVRYRLMLFENKRRSRPRPHLQREFNYDWFKTLGIHQLSGTVRYPNASIVLAKANV